MTLPRAAYCKCPATGVLTACRPRVYAGRVTAKTHMAGIRASKRTLAIWTRRAKAAGMSFNKWATLVLNSAPDVKPAAISSPEVQEA